MRLIACQYSDWPQSTHAAHGVQPHPWLNHIATSSCTEMTATNMPLTRPSAFHLCQLCDPIPNPTSVSLRVLYELAHSPADEHHREAAEG